MKRFKYIAAYILPITVLIALSSRGLWTFLPLITYFGVVPVMELLFPPDARNLDEKQAELAAKDIFYDLVLYMMVPLQWGILIYFLCQVTEPGLTWFELAGRVSSMGLMCGVIGINVGHELGHRPPGFAHFCGELLMLSSLENHFIPYHNLGHHLNVATPDDPATARKNESVYYFWLRSHFGSYWKAWQIEKDRMSRIGRRTFSWSNKMVRYTLAQITVISAVYLFFGWKGLLAFITAAMLGIILLETVNYIEHYGLLRKRNERGRFERVRHHHSWNSDYVIGRVVLFELSRHSDHHYKASKKYQLLDSLDSSPQMPTGYPGMMLLALVPPLWFKYMNARIEAFSILDKPTESGLHVSE